jgi:hypothetical protein
MFCNQASNLIPYVAQPADATFDSHNSQKIPGKNKNRDRPPDLVQGFQPLLKFGESAEAALVAIWFF